MSIEFQKGSQVVCVDDNWDKWFEIQSGLIFKYPIKENVYTIREIIKHNQGAFIGFLFEEILNPRIPKEYCYRQLELSFIHEAFKPLKKTNIDIFTSMLNPSLVKEKVLEII